MNEPIKNRNVFSVREGRVELIHVKIEWPQFTDENGPGEKVVGNTVKKNRTEKRTRQAFFNLYYSKLAVYAAEWAEGFAQSRIRAEYDAASERERKFCFARYIYSVCYRIEEFDGGRVRIVYEFKLRRGGDILIDRIESDIWNTDSLLIEPARRNIKHRDSADKLFHRYRFR